ncbi:MAG: DUF4185 domain-containing protein, partial [Ignavibacteriales bacterium]
ITLMLMYLMFSGCKITKITQPVSAAKNSEITISISVTANIVPETNPHKGLVGVLIPKDWQVLGGTYQCRLGSGQLLVDNKWADSIEVCYPSGSFKGNMKWVTLVSDQGFTYSTPVDIDFDLKLKTGDTEGCFNLGYLVSKATPGLICSGQSAWAPFSYPNKISLPLGTVCEDDFKAEKAPDWDSLLDRNSGWTGSDGIYSIPLNMSEKPEGQDHLILFSDTFIGTVDASKKRTNTKMVNNTLAYLKGNKPVSDSISFYWNNQNGQPASVFVPNTPNAKPGEYYWLMDGVKINETFHVFAMRLSTTGGGAFDFTISGAAVISFNLSKQNTPENVKQTDFPFFYKNDNTQLIYGQAILPNTSVSGNKNYDGYIYVYGPKDSKSTKELVAGRVKPEDILNFDKWQFWNGSTWVSDFLSSAGITSQISQEFSVSEINDKYMLVFQTGSAVAVRMGDSPVGPFDFYNVVYQCPEVNISGNVFVYNAKAHPSLSDNGSVLISYNVNTMDFAENLNNADIYRPRFIRLKVMDNQTGIEKGRDIPTAYLLFQNYPNPFNPVTNIEFEIKREMPVSLKIYNVLGELVSTLLDSKVLPSGRYKTSWAALNASTGIYFYVLETPDSRVSKKMVLLK